MADSFTECNFTIFNSYPNNKSTKTNKSTPDNDNQQKSPSITPDVQNGGNENKKMVDPAYKSTPLHDPWFCNLTLWSTISTFEMAEHLPHAMSILVTVSWPVAFGRTISLVIENDRTCRRLLHVDMILRTIWGFLPGIIFVNK